ncbi:M14 family metallopeptidase [Staphylococcus saprophyticus]|uniref:M14 family metallopeptidase n=1 Tax=Staphylococcus saprophyticus TaxID=29385 RepID=UPI00390641D1
MGRKNIDAFWDRQNLYNLNTNFDELFRIVETVRDISLDLVNDSKLTEEQFQRLQIELNGLLKKGEVSIFDINKNLGKIDQSFLTEELIQQIAGNANVNAIPADNSITTGKYVNKSITPEKTNFIKTSDNLLNKNDVITGKNLSTTTGELINSGSGVVFNKWFELKSGTTYVSSNLYARVFYDEKKQFISGTTGNSDFVVPSNAKYTRFSTTSLDNAQLNIGSVLKPYDEYVKPYLSEDIAIKELGVASVGKPQLKNNSVTIDKVDFISRSNNLIDKNKISKGYAFNSEGSINENSRHAISDYVPIIPNQTYTSSTNSSRINFYDENKKYLGQIFSSDFTTTFTAPPNAHYLRTNITISRFEDAMLNVGSELLPYEDWHEPTLEGVKLSKDNETSTPVEPGKPVEIDKSSINHFAIDDHLKLDYTPPTITGIGDNDPIPAGNIAYTDYYTYYDELMANNPDYITKTLAGTDKDGREIYRYDFKPERPKYTKNSSDIERDFDKPKIFLVSSTHGNERTVIWALYNTMKLICEQWQENEALEFLRWNAHFIVIPIISPSGYSKATRINGNGVDLNRNYTASWANGDADSSKTTYRGTEPLSEPEAKICDNIMKNENLTFVIDYHNFHTTSESNFNWIIGSSPFVNAIGEQLLSKMARKWKKNNPDIPQDSRFFGYVSPMINVGSMTNQAIKEYGISSALFEVCWVFDDKPGTEKRDSFISTIATDTVINYLILILKNANKL